MNATALDSERLAIARLLHRFSFGPTPGQYAALVKRGVGRTQRAVLATNPNDPGLSGLSPPLLADLGVRPPPKTPAEVVFRNALIQGNTALVNWWLDRMALAQYPLVERMTWFWHGHWATSIAKVEYPLSMQIQNNTLRAHALGNFSDMARAMVVDGALNDWLDNQSNLLRAPNENMARELMELFTLGVNNYTQADVTAAARALTGYSVVRSNGTVTFSSNRHDASTLTVLGSSGPLDGPGLATLLTAQSTNATFIANRLWFRFVSSTSAPPASLAQSFATRDITAVVRALVHTRAWTRAGNSLVKSPVEWFIGACRALRVQPSTLAVANLGSMLTQMGQVPFNPPNVGGWTYDEAWLNSAALQYRLQLAQLIVAQGSLAPLSVPAARRVAAAADWFGVARWSTRTANVLADSTTYPAQLAVVALCAPEYVVSQ